MEPIRSGITHNIQVNSVSPVQGAQSAIGIHASGHANSLIPHMLSDHTVSALNAKEAQGNEQEKMLAGLVKWAIESSQLQLSPNQTPNHIAQFGMRRNQDVLVIKTRLNDQSKYDILSVGFRRGSESPLSMTLLSPSTAAPDIVNPPSTLLSLPNELLLQITQNTGNRDEGVNLNLRRVNRQMKVIADDKMSSRQRFFTEHAKTLSDSGYSHASKEGLLYLSPAQQSFALINGPMLRAAAGYNGSTINYLAKCSPAIQNFVFMHGSTLRATAGYDGFTINDLAECSPAVQNFASTYGPTLHATAGYDGGSINELAKSASTIKTFALTHGAKLHTTAGYRGHDINGLAGLLPAYQQFALAHGAVLHAHSGYDGESTNFLTTFTQSRQNFVLNNGPRLRAEGYSSSDINLLALHQD